jgi:hypothetical protein
MTAIDRALPPLAAVALAVERSRLVVNPESGRGGRERSGITVIRKVGRLERGKVVVGGREEGRIFLAGGERVNTC